MLISITLCPIFSAPLPLSLPLLSEIFVSASARFMIPSIADQSLAASAPLPLTRRPSRSDIAYVTA